MANRYWVGGTATWDNTAGTKWALTSGGAGDQAVPTTDDDVFFDTSSGANTVTIGIIAQAKRIFLTGFTGTLAFGTNKIQLSGSNTTVFSGTSATTITGTPLIECIYSGSVGQRTISTGTTTEANSISFSITAGSDTVAISTVVRDLDFTGFSGTLSFSNRTIYGSVTLSTGMTLSSGSTQTWAATSGIKTIRSNNKTWDTSHTFNGVGGTWRLIDALTTSSARLLTLTNGTFDANDQNVTTGQVGSSNNNTRTFTMGSGTWTLGGVATVWNFGTVSNLTLNAGTSTIALSDTSTSSKTFSGGGRTYNNLSISATTGIANYVITGANTFNSISSSKTVACTITLPSSNTTTVTTWSASGLVSNLLTLNSSTSGTTTTLAITNAATLNYVAVSDVITSDGTKTINNGYVSRSSTGWVLGSGSRYFELLTTGTSWTAPNTWKSTANEVHLIGGGGGGAGSTANSSNRAGGGGGGGGGYAKLVNQSYTVGQAIIYSVGAVGSSGGDGGSTGSTAGTGGTTSWGISQNTIAYVSSTQAVQNTASTTITIQKPFTSSGNLMIMILSSNTASNTWTTPSGWTLGTAGANGRALFWKISASEPSSYTITQSASNTSNAFIIAYSNATFDTSGLAAQTTNSPITPVAITVARTNSTIIYVASRNDGQSITFTTPTGYTARISDSDGTTPSTSVFDLANVASGSYTAPSTTPSNLAGRAFVIALSPTTSSSTASATGGAGGTSTPTPSSTGGAGGTGSGGTLNYTGGTGGAGSTFSSVSVGHGGGGGGGAGGPNGNGGNGGTGFASGTAASVSGGGGGGNGGGSAGGNAAAGVSGAGGNNSLGTGGGASRTGAGAGVSGTNGGGGSGSVQTSNAAGIGSAGIDIIPALSLGSGGGSGGGTGGVQSVGISGFGSGGGGNGTTVFGATVVGNGSARAGAIVLIWEAPAVTSTGNMFLMF
jgi:hypothetical protein